MAQPTERTTHLSEESAHAPSWLSAVTRAFPYAFGEYVIFLGLVEWNAGIATFMGFLLLALAAGLAALQVGMIPAGMGSPAIWARMLTAWLGNLREMMWSFLALGASLLVWVVWYVTGAVVLSWLSLLGLIAAMFFTLRAQHAPRTEPT